MSNSHTLPPLLGGIHDREGRAMAIPGCWILDTISLSENQQPASYTDGDFKWIGRLNWGYGGQGTLPPPAQLGEYLNRVQRYVKASPGCHVWIPGNEPNLPREWPSGQSILPEIYAEAYLQTRALIHAIPGHADDQVLVAGPGPWNADLKYAGNELGDWVAYFEDVMEVIGNDVDGFSFHAYCHGYEPALVTSEATMDAPFRHRHYEFRTYRDLALAIRPGLRHLPIYLTEANGNGPWQARGLIPAMLEEISQWNARGEQTIRAVIFYRFPAYDAFAIDGKPDVITEWQNAVARYPGPQRATTTPQSKPMQTLIPSLSTGSTAPAQPQRDIDPRLTQRGVTIETPPIAPGQPYWRIVKARWYNEQEAQGRHHIYVEAIDVANRPIPDMAFRVTWPTDNTEGHTNGRAGFDAGNFPMSASRNEFSVRIAGIPSETLKGIGMGAETPGGFNAGIHTSTGVVFQLTNMAEAQPAPAPTEPAPQPQPEPAPQGDTWSRSRAFVRRWEGGYQNNPNDVGNWTGCKVGVGENNGTNYGISACSYPQLDIQSLTLAEADAIYQRDYWQASGAASLPWPLCLLAFDTAVLHGVGTARQWLQEVGPNPYAFAAKRLHVYTQLGNWHDFGAGWVNRTADLLEEMGKP